MRRQLILCGLVLAMLLGCASEPRAGQWAGPASPVEVSVEPWQWNDQPGRIVTTPHYIIHSTLEDQALLLSVAQVMEGALIQYRQLAPDVRLTTRPMECWLFETRQQWADFTRQSTGEQAAVYLQIVRGGYTIRDRYVAFYLGQRGTWSVAAHEGWHQFVARHFIGRLPPFLEEGIACMFESVTWSDGLPRWNLSINPNRAGSLRRSIENDELWPLDELITLHAGEIVGQSNRRIQAFYAQSWAFARFLWEAEDARHRPALRRLLADTANGDVRDPTRTLQRAGRGWDPRGVRPMFEYYLGMDFEEIESAFNTWMHHIAYEEYRSHWRM